MATKTTRPGSGILTRLTRDRATVFLAANLFGTLVFGASARTAHAQAKPAKSAISAPAPASPRNPATATTTGGAPVPEAPKVKVERGAGGHKVYRITEEIRIEGKIQKPEAFFFYQKSNMGYDWEELKQDFIPKILDSVSKAPF